MTWQDFLALPRSRYFWAERENGRYTCGNPDSFYLKGASPEEATFDTGNNRAITLSGLDGEIKALTLFKESYFADNIPGVWVHKGRILAGPFAFGLREDGTETDLPRYPGKIRTELAECVIPITTYALPGLSASVVTFAPISADGGVRPRGAFTILMLQNTGSTQRRGEVLPPRMAHFSSIMEHGNDSQIDIRMAEEFSRARPIPFSLAPGERLLTPVWLGVYGESADEGLRKGFVHWLEQTLLYYRGLTGQLSFSEEPFLTEFWTRTLCQCQQCIGMDAQGNLAGSSWGTNPTTEQIWMKDMYYSMLPLAQADPMLFQ